MQRSAKPQAAAIDGEAALAGFIDRYSADVAALAKASLAKLRIRLAGACLLVYDNYNALAIGFGPSERTSEAILSLALYPRWVNLCFLQRASSLPDPQRLLVGTGRMARHVRLQAALDLDRPEIEALIEEALARAAVPIARAANGRIVIKSISDRQRPRRP